MNIHEYQAREIFVRHGIPVPEAEVAATADPAETAAAAGQAVPVEVTETAEAAGQAVP